MTQGIIPPLPPVIAFAPHPWWNHWLSRQQLLSRLGRRGWPVIYSFGPLNIWYRHTPQWRQSPWLGWLEERDHVRVDHPGRLPPLWPRFSHWDRWVIRHHAGRMLGGMEKNRGSMRPVAFLFHPTFEPWLQWLNPSHVVYHVFDAYRMMETWTPAKAAMEKRLIERADLITTSSQGMADTLPWGGNHRAHVLNNGADAHRFLAAEGCLCPEDLAVIPSPRIGYVGSINPKLDLEMVLTLSHQRPEWHWVFIGPVYMDGLTPRDERGRQHWQQCLARPNIHWLKRKTLEDMPAYLNHLDVHAICYLIARDQQGLKEDWVVHGYPTKLHECLATGRPVVAAAQQVIVDDFQHVVCVARSSDEWEMAIAGALVGQGVGTVAERRAVALANTWDARVDQLEQWLLAMIRQ
ncbi:MAG: glycosyl transferase, group 1 [Magnetococcales bacterium]|nr:glycosyl transferase, group 1 [Magnetococcales bacterium]HIJ85297.1 glycosyltransferase [Magnetococcales bacterium]